jgi:hypothetical protein
MRMRSQFLFIVLCVVVTLGLTVDASLSQPQTKTEKPEPSVGSMIQASAAATITDPGVTPKAKDHGPFGAPPMGVSWPAFTFDTNNVTTPGWYFIPPDPIGASGPFHVLNVGNVSIQWFNKVGVQQGLMSLQNFFGSLGPPLGTYTFDPKVIYDQYSDRFVVITLERLDSGGVTGSYILVAVSMTNDPNGAWNFLAINSKLNVGGTSSWADYPGLAVDDKAIYITNNMFAFSAGGGGYTGQRLWIIDKNPFYTGGAGVWGVFDPFTAAAIPTLATTAQPAHMFGPLPAGLGTYICYYSGLTAGGVGGSEFVGVIEVTDPLGTGGGPFFTNQYVPCGDIEDVGGVFSWPPLPDAPQLGSGIPIEVNDRRALNAVWRDSQLHVSTTIVPNAGPDIGQTTAHWWRLDTMAGIGGIFTADQGDVGAEDIHVGTFTFFPSVMVDHCGNMAIGFAASNSSMYCGAYYTGRKAADPPGTVQPTGVLRAGLDWYVRTFGGSRNRWGDYSGLSLDPADQVTFWVFNEYAEVRGTPLGTPPEDGRWGTQWGSFVIGCPPVAVAITAFDVRAVDGGVELTGAFETDAANLRVNVYRSVEGLIDSPIRYQSVEMNANEPFRYVDSNVEPGKTYSYHIGVVDSDGEFLSSTSRITIPAAETALWQNEPNPFNPTTTISFVLPSAQQANLAIYDANGKLVRTLVDGVRGFGSHHVEWDGTDNVGNKVGSGVYFYRLTAGKFQQSRKMVLLK